MDKLKFLNKKDSEKIVEILNSQFGFNGELDYIFALSAKNNVYIVNKDLARLDIDKLRLNSVGLYFGEMVGTEIRMSIEGTQIIGTHCSKNVIELSFAEELDWLKGKDIEKTSGEDAFKLLRKGDDFLGCGRQSGSKILNYMPKTRRLSLKGEYFGQDA